MNATLTLEDLHKAAEAVDSLLPEINNEHIDAMIKFGHRIDEIALVHSRQELKEVGTVRTQHGKMQVIFMPYAPPHTMYLMKKPSWPEPQWVR